MESCVAWDRSFQIQLRLTTLGSDGSQWAKHAVKIADVDENNRQNTSMRETQRRDKP